MSKLYGWIAALGSSLLALVFLLVGQKEKARQKQREAESKVKVSEKTRDTENRIREAQNEARQQAEKLKEQRDERPTHIKPSGSFRRD